ncbi:hypothetical protein ACFSL6_24550, partial [Paenibacillus thailandensis]
YSFQYMPKPLQALLEGTIDVPSYLKLDESLVQTAFGEWAEEDDDLLRDLCDRFLNRRLYKYITLDNPDEKLLNEIEEQWRMIGLHPDYHMEIDFPYDQPYDVYRPDTKKGEKEEKTPILLLDEQDHLNEISRKSDIVRSITGLHQGQYHLYYPEEPLLRAAGRLPAGIRELFKLDARQAERF